MARWYAPPPPVVAGTLQRLQLWDDVRCPVTCPFSPPGYLFAGLDPDPPPPPPERLLN